MITDELRMRAVTSREIGIDSPAREAVADTGRNGRVLIVDDRRASHERIAAMLAEEQNVDVEPDPSEALFRAADGNYDLLIVSLALENFDALRLCSQVRSLDRTRNMPILAIAEPDSNARMVRGLEIGVNDYLMRPIDKNELLARARSQVRKRRYTERLRDNVQSSIEMAITDALTGLFNRRYMESHLAGLLDQATARGKPLAVLVIDIDYFKSINESHGHDAGDDVLREFALRIKRSIRGIDLACRYGGEEFVVVMPETDTAVAAMVAERLRRRIAAEPFAIHEGADNIPVTISIGLPLCAEPMTAPPPFSSAPIRRSIAPSATGETGWCRTRHDRFGRGSAGSLSSRAMAVGSGESALWLTRIRLFGGILAVDFPIR